MKRITLSIFFTLSLLVLGCTSEPTIEMEQYGEALTVAEVTPIADILANPDAFVGKKVRIEGNVKDVCPMKGCWMEVEDEAGDKMLRVKVEDDVIVFKQETKGQPATAEGEVEAIELTQEKAVAYLAHLAEEKGEAFDSTSVTGPMTIYQIKGIGAEVAKVATEEEAD